MSFFFISSYDQMSAEILHLFLNKHPDIHCSMQRPNTQIPTFIDGTLDEFMTANTSSVKKYSGNIGNFSAYELQHRILDERTQQPFKKVQILLSPMIRIQLIIYNWLKSGLAPQQLLRQFEDELRKSANSKKNSFAKLYQVVKFYNHVVNAINLNKEKFEKLKLTNQNPEIDKILACFNGQYHALFCQALTLAVTYDSADLPCSIKRYRFDRLLESEAEFTDMIRYLTNSEISLSPGSYAQFQLSTQNIFRALHQFGNSYWNPLYTSFVHMYLNAKLDTVYSSHINKTIAQLYETYDFPQVDEQPFQIKKLLSIQLNSNRPAQLSAYLDNIEETTDRPQDIEVVVNIDIDDDVMKTLLDTQIPKRKFTLKYTQSPRPTSFFDLWKPLNKLLTASDPEAYFLLNISDEMFFLTKGWDTILRKYVGFFPDHIFRLRASRNKFKNYFDRWECNNLQDSIPITTRKWVDIGGDWNPCFGPDSFQQLIAFYLAKDSAFSYENISRDIPIIDIQFAGDVPALGVSPEKHWKMVSQAIRAMQICQSYKMQLEAYRRAMLIRANIYVASKQIMNAKIVDLKKKKVIQIFSDDHLKMMFSYKLSWLSITLTNQWRKFYFYNYFGDGIKFRPSPLFGIIRYLVTKHKFALKVLDTWVRTTNFIKSPLKSIKKSFKPAEKTS